MPDAFKMSEKAIFLIDGAYLSYVCKFLGGGKYIKFKIQDFVKNISKRIGIDCNMVYFYTAPPYQSPKPTENENNKKANYDKFISKLNATPNPKIIVKEGRCQKIANDFSQKGVDTLITMDLLKLSLDKSMNKIILMTADTDFVPIIKEVMKNKEIILVYFTDKKRKSAFALSNHLWNICENKIKVNINDFKSNI